MTKELIQEMVSEIKQENSNISLDNLLYAIYERIKRGTERFDTIKPLILETLQIDEYEYYTKKVNPRLKKYIEENYFPEYEKNDKGHGLAHMLEVVRRSFALNDTFQLGLDENMIYLMATLHDVGKHINSENHPFISASIFYQDETFRTFFDENQRLIMKEAIEDHGHAKEGIRSIYGKLLSSADRNTSIRVVFIRSFHVAHERTPDMNIEEYLDFTWKRLKKRYSEEKPENMFFEDETYKTFLQEMRDLLKREEEFKNLYCEINHITNRNHLVCEEEGEPFYYKSLKKIGS